MLENKISVIMTTHNGRRAMCQRAIESVLSQTYKDWELIIIDDASRDGTKEMVQEYQQKDSRIRYFLMPNNFGNDTRPKNLGIKEAKGNYIALLDSDNEFTPDHLLILSKESERHPDIDVIYGDRLVISDDREMEPQVGIASDFNPSFLIERNYIDTSDVLVKKNALFFVGGFDERYEKYVDWNLWIRMMKAGLKFLRVPKVITRYHLHKQMKSLRVKDKVGDKPFGNITPEPVFRPKWDAFELEIRLPFLGDVPKPSVAVFTLTKDRLDYTKRMYEGLKKADYELTWVVIDQGSTDGTVKWLQSLPKDKNIHTHFIFNHENKGISMGSNQALDYAQEKGFDFIIKIDNDCEINTNEWLSRLLYVFQAHWQIILSPYVEGLIDNAGGAPRLAYKTFRGHLIGITNHIGGIFVMAHKSAYKDFRFDTDDFLHSHQDVMFSQEMMKRGFLIGYIEDMKVAHMDTTDGQKQKYPNYFEHRKYERTHIYGK